MDYFEYYIGCLIDLCRRPQPFVPLSSTEVSVLAGNLVLSRINPFENCTLASSNEPNNPVVNRLRLTWKAEYITYGYPTVNAPSLKSDAFLLGGCSLKTHLGLEIIPFKCLNLFLQVATEHVEGIIGRVVVFANSKNPVSDSLISKSNVVDGNRWILPTPNLKDFSCRYDLMLNFEIEMEYVIIDCEQEFAPNESKISKDIALMLSDKDTTDVTLKVGSTELRAHKFMLSTRSPVLKTMLSADMLEGRTGVIELQNMSLAAAKAFLSFIYMAQITDEELAETAEELLAAAVMYDMPELHSFAEFALRDLIAVENAGRLLMIACLYDAVKLKIQTLFYIKSNKAAVTASQGWKQVVAANPTVMFEAIMDIV